MNRRLEDNKFAFILISLLALAIAVIGLVANSIYFEYGGFSVGMACTVLLFAAFCLIYSQVSKEIKKRTIDMFFMSLFVVCIYAIVCLLVDISQIATKGMGITLLVFLGLFWLITLWELTRLVLEIFNIRIKFYEELLAGKNPFKKIFKKKEIAVNMETEPQETNEGNQEKLNEEKIAKEDNEDKKKIIN